MRKITLLLTTVCMALTGYAQENRALFSGDGLSDSTAYEIRTPAQLARLAELVNAGNADYSGRYFKLAATMKFLYHEN